MAVVQISRIQVRRGQKLSGVGVPQLSSGEFAWAVDTQELFIGNGSLAEGAPYVGNTKILTEHDNLLSLANSYRFRDDDPSMVKSVGRSLQGKLDEIEVSVVDFGAVPDGSTDCTQAFHDAFEELFLKTNDTLKKVLKIPNGVYLFFSDLKIPSRAILRGENQYETVLEIGNNSIIFVSENQTEPGSFTSTDIPQKVRIENLTVDHLQGQTVITASQQCVFDKVLWRSDYQQGDTGFVPINANGLYNIPIVTTGGFIRVSGSGVTATIATTFATSYIATLTTFVGILNADGIFNNDYVASIEATNLKITSNSPTALASTIAGSFLVEVLTSSEIGTVVQTVSPTLSEFSDGSQQINSSVFWQNDLFGTRATSNRFVDCNWSNTKLAVECQQTDVFATEIYFDNCGFNICDTAIYINGLEDQENRWQIKSCRFTQIAAQAVNITAGQGTQIIDCKFESCGNGINTSQYPETSVVRFGQALDNVVIDCSSDRQRLSGGTSLSTSIGFPEYEGATFVRLIDRNYSPIYLSDSYRPLAVFSIVNKSIVIDYVLTLGIHTRTGRITVAIDTAGSQATLSDNSTYSSGGATMVNFQFDAEAVDNDLDSGNETVLLKYSNPLISGSTGFISYSVSLGV